MRGPGAGTAAEVQRNGAQLHQTPTSVSVLHITLQLAQYFLRITMHALNRPSESK